MSPVGAPALARSLYSCFEFSQLGNRGKFFISLSKQRVHIPQYPPTEGLRGHRSHRQCPELLCSPDTGSGCGAGISWFTWSFSALLWGFHVGNYAACAVPLVLWGFLYSRCFLCWLQAHCSSSTVWARVKRFWSLLGCASVWQALVKPLCLSGPRCTAPAGRAVQRWHYVHLFIPSALEN